MHKVDLTIRDSYSDGVDYRTLRWQISASISISICIEPVVILGSSMRTHKWLHRWDPPALGSRGAAYAENYFRMEGGTVEILRTKSSSSGGWGQLPGLACCTICCFMLLLCITILILCLFCIIVKPAQLHYIILYYIILYQIILFSNYYVTLCHALFCYAM